jgi:diguanylate cyclase (GGDEF)-like protein
MRIAIRAFRSAITLTITFPMFPYPLQIPESTVRPLLKPPHFALLALAFVVLHVVCILVFSAQATAASYPFLILAPSIALACTCWRAFISKTAPRSQWALLSAGLLLWTCGMILSAWEDIFQHAPLNAAWFSDFSYFLYGAPVLLAISATSARERIPFLLGMDAAQTLLAGFLVYVSIFSVMPFSDVRPSPANVSALVFTYNAENLLLAVAVSFRLLAEPRGAARRFYAILFYFLWIYAATAWIFNRWAATFNGTSPMDALVDLPFLFLAIAIVTMRSRDEDSDAPSNQSTLSLLIESISPVFYTLALLALSISLIGRHFYVGTVGIMTALVAYTARSTLLQLRYALAQRQLREAGERLQQMALTDALTNTANRRRFDDALMHEWNRAIRNGHPIALLMIDIDYFKMLNDRHGHPAGDRCLVSVALALQSVLPRSGDLLARYGGEEFAAILPATDEAGARIVATAMQKAVHALGIPNETPIGPFVTISVGIAVGDPPRGSATSIMEVADQALYRAKQHGRNRVELAV